MPPGPLAAGVPNANLTITVNPAAKYPHKRRKPKGSLLGRAALKASPPRKGGLDGPGSTGLGGHWGWRWPGRALGKTLLHVAG